jgi:hypothetical protein
MADEEIVYYEKTTSYPIVVRENMRDHRGFLLNSEQPYVGVKKNLLRDFVLANRYAISNGLILEIPEPSIEIQTPNAYTNDEIKVLLKNYIQLKKKLPEITSEPLLYRILNLAKEENRPPKTIQLIMDRLEELTPVAMRGVE